VVGAVVVSEDWAFFEHGGYDVRQIREAVREDLKARRFVRGASTLTQQLARTLFLEKDKNLWRKLKELLLAVQLEREFEKRRILEFYINVVDWGRGIYGIQRAAEVYFEKTPGELSAKEGAFLAMLLPNPRNYSASFYQGELTPFAESSINRILDNMVKGRFITLEEAERARHIPLPFEKSVEFDQFDIQP
jgi:monofunctional biosynthetic peptidoglycan transglycosylase